MGFTSKVSRSEFDNPDRMAPWLVNSLVEERERLGRPMFFTKLSSGAARHPHGDAVPPDSPHHGKYSYHRWGINHVPSKAQQTVIHDPTFFGLAVDMDLGAINFDEMMNLYLHFSQQALWRGVGLYPFWNNPGFHLDLGGRIHYWARDVDGTYLPLRGPNAWQNINRLRESVRRHRPQLLSS